MQVIRVGSYLDEDVEIAKKKIREKAELNKRIVISKENDYIEFKDADGETVMLVSIEVQNGIIFTRIDICEPDKTTENG